MAELERDNVRRQWDRSLFYFPRVCFNSLFFLGHITSYFTFRGQP